MPRWLQRVLARIHRLAAEGKVGETAVHVKLVLRAHCVVISFHGGESRDENED
jgi:hypothetical protein